MSNISNFYSKIISFKSTFFPSKTIRSLLKTLDEIELEFDDLSFYFSYVKSEIKSSIVENQKDYIKVLNSGKSYRELILVSIANFSGNLVESGNFHVYRGCLDSTGEGILKVFYKSLEDLVKINAIDLESANIQREAIKETIDFIG